MKVTPVRRLMPVNLNARNPQHRSQYVFRASLPIAIPNSATSQRAHPRRPHVTLSQITWKLQELLQADDRNPVSNTKLVNHGYNAFCAQHKLLLDAEETLALFVVYMWAYCKLKVTTIRSYLTDICLKLVAKYPRIRKARSSFIVLQALRCAKTTSERQITALQTCELHVSSTRLFSSGCLTLIL